MNNNEIEKFPLDSMDIKQEQISRLKELFPEVFTEGNKLDWEKLKLTLGEDIDVGKERFGLNWAGKSDCFKLIQQPSTGTLVPAREESINFDTTENLFIEGDNLEVLKLIQKSYFGKVKMIYIDPPYNTGHDFVYIDDFKDNLKNYLELTGQVDSGGKKLSTNVESDGRFHSNWLNMLYPRLYLAKNLLKEDGVIFISIDDNEVHNLKALCNEIFGEENFVACVSWRKSDNQANIGLFARVKEYQLIYCKSILTLRLNKVSLTDRAIKEYRYSDNRGKFRREIILDKTRGRHYYDVVTPSGKILNGPWMLREDKFNILKENDSIYWTKGGDEQPYGKLYLSESEGQIPNDFLGIEYGTNQEGSLELEALFGARCFDFPKNTTLIKYLLSIGLDNNSIILDFFAGSCTTAHSVMELNSKDGGNRKFICVQIPEFTDESSLAFKAGYLNIAEIGKERIRRVIKKIETEKEKEEPDMFEGDKKPQDLGFKVFKLQSSNFATWDANVEKSIDALTEKLFQHIDHISPEAEQDAILYELLLKAGFELTTQIEKLTVADKTVYSVMENVLLICLERNLTHELLKAIAELKPVRFICLDEGFRDNDQLKSNAVLLMKENGVQKFQAV